MMHSFLLIGQSNMAGRGDMSQAVPVDTTHIYTLRNGRWHPMFRPITPDRSFSGVNLAESFAEAYANRYGVDVGLICCADGGTSLEQWQVGGLLYDHAIAQAKLAARTSTIVGVLWHQGESECEPSLAATYQERFEPILHAFRRDLQIPEVPFLLGELGEFLSDCVLNDLLKNYPQVNEQLHAVAAANPYTACVSAKGLTANADQLHFNSASLHAFGLRYFEAFEKLYDPSKIGGEKDADLKRSAMEQY